MAIRKPSSKDRSAAKAKTKTKTKTSSSDLAVPSNAAMDRKLRAEQAKWQAEEGMRSDGSWADPRDCHGDHPDTDGR